MIQPSEIDLSPAEAAAFVRDQLATARSELSAGRGGSAITGWVCALGLALQLGPAPVQEVLAAVVAGAGVLAEQQQADLLAETGPALVGLVTAVRDAGALPATWVMDSWAAAVTEMGALIGQIGLALDVTPAHRAGMLDGARRRALLIDEATDGAFSLGAWLDGMVDAWSPEHDG